MKSYKTVGGDRGRKLMPSWAENAPSAMRVTTTDTQFDLVRYLKGPNGRTLVCWRDGRQRWHEAEIENRRIRSITP